MSSEAQPESPCSSSLGCFECARAQNTNTVSPAASCKQAKQVQDTRASPLFSAPGWSMYVTSYMITAERQDAEFARASGMEKPKNIALQHLSQEVHSFLVFI
jgi:hypothetical protein